MKKVQEFLDEGEALRKVVHTSPSVPAREGAMVKLFALAEVSAVVHIPGLGGPRLASKRNHLAETLKSIERFEAKREAGNPAVGGRIRELKAEARVLTESIRREEDALLARLEEAEA